MHRKIPKKEKGTTIIKKKLAIEPKILIIFPEILSPKIVDSLIGKNITTTKLQINKIIPVIPNKKDKVNFKSSFILLVQIKFSTFQFRLAIGAYKV